MNARMRLPDHIDTLLLDLDGTLLDLAFDTHFWHEVVPEYFGRTRGMTASEALEKEIGPRLRSAEGTLNWYSLDYWSRMLELDLSAIKSEHDSRIAWLPGAQDFLQRQRAAGRRLVLATNSHPETLRIKDEKVAIRPLLDAVYSSHQFGAPKEHAEFWLRPAQGRALRSGAHSLHRRQCESARRRARRRYPYRHRHNRAGFGSPAARAAGGLCACRGRGRHRLSSQRFRLRPSAVARWRATMTNPTADWWRSRTAG